MLPARGVAPTPPAARRVGLFLLLFRFVDSLVFFIWFSVFSYLLMLVEWMAGVSYGGRRRRRCLPSHANQRSVWQFCMLLGFKQSLVETNLAWFASVAEPQVKRSTSQSLQSISAHDGLPLHAAAPPPFPRRPSLALERLSPNLRDAGITRDKEQIVSERSWPSNTLG